MSKNQTDYSGWHIKRMFSLAWKNIRDLYKRPLYWYYKQRGFQKLKIDEISAEFDTSNQDAIERIRWMYWREKEQVAHVIDELQEDDVFFDIGANLGLYTAFSSKKLKKGKVESFEPYPPNIGILEKNSRRNGTNIDIHEIALSDDQGTANFQQTDDSVGSQVGALAPQNEESTYKVETDSVDRLVSTTEIPVPNVIKIDVEGAESLVLEGMEKTLERKSCRAIFCEIHPRSNSSRPSVQYFGSSVEKILDFIKSKGFDVHTLRPYSEEKVLIAKKKKR
jgi:FkbM family methyltransferase